MAAATDHLSMLLWQPLVKITNKLLKQTQKQRESQENLIRSP